MFGIQAPTTEGIQVPDIRSIQMVGFQIPLFLFKIRFVLKIFF